MAWTSHSDSMHAPARAGMRTAVVYAPSRASGMAVERAVSLALVLLMALVLRAWVLRSLRFDGLYGQDAFAYYHYGVALWHDHTLWYQWPWQAAPTRLFWPVGFPALLALAFTLAGHAGTTPALATVVTSGLGVVAAGYLLALRVADLLFDTVTACGVATLTAALLAVAGLEMQASTTIMSDAPALCWGTIAMLLWLLAGIRCAAQISGGATNGPRLMHGTTLAFGAGACFAVAVTMRLEYAPLALAMLIYWAMAAATGPLMARRSYMVLLAAGVGGALLAGMPLVVTTLGDSQPVLHHQWLATWNPAHLWQSRFTTVDGTQQYDTSAGVFYLLRPLVASQSLPFMLAPLLPVGVAALWTAGRRSTPGGAAPNLARGALVLLLAWWLIPGLYLAGVPFESARFALIYAPPLALLEAIGLAAVAHWAYSSVRRDQQALRRAIGVGMAVWVAVSLLFLAVGARKGVGVLAGNKVDDMNAVTWLDIHAPDGATIVTFALTLTLSHYGALPTHHWTVHDLSAVTPADLQRAVAARHLVVVANEGNLANQWHGKPVGDTFIWLRGHARLQRVTRIGVYTVFVQ